MELFKNVNIDWLGKKWYLMSVSALLIALGVASLIAKGGPKLGIDFTGGTVIVAKFKATPELEKIRAALRREDLGGSVIQRYGSEAENQVQIKLERAIGEEEDVELVGRRIYGLLKESFDAGAAADRIDLNNIGRDELPARLLETDPARLGAAKSLEERRAYYQDMAARIIGYRNELGIIGDFSELKQLGITDQTAEQLEQKFYLGSSTIQQIESVGPVVSRDLREKAQWAIGLSLSGMLIYIAFRFKHPVYGLAAVIAVFHDVLVTVGLFSLTNKEISLTVIAALLTLVGYSVNDTIVIFDRVRENLALMRRESLEKIVNTSINQTLSRTILTSSTVFMAVLSLLLFGGEVLNGFAFALTVGTIVGSYSTLAIAGPVVVLWRGFEMRRKAKSTARPTRKSA